MLRFLNNTGYFFGISVVNDAKIIFPFVSHKAKVPEVKYLTDDEDDHGLPEPRLHLPVLPDGWVALRAAGLPGPGVPVLHVPRHVPHLREGCVAIVRYESYCDAVQTMLWRESLTPGLLS